MQNLVKLNIGSHLFQTSRDTLCPTPDGYFAGLLQHPPDHDGYYFIDREGTVSIVCV